MASSEIAVTPAAEPSPRVNMTRTIALSLWLLGVTLSLTSLLMIAVTLDRPAPEQYAFRGFEASIALPWGVVGALIALRRPGNRLGWFLLAVAILAGIQGVVDQYPILADAGLVSAESAVLPRWVSSWLWVLGMSGLLTFLPLMLPDGRLLSPRWRPVLVLAIAAVSGMVVILGGATQPVGPFPLTRDIGPILATSPWAAAPFLLFIAASGLAVLSLVLRFVRSKGEQRQQLKWVAYGGVAGVLGLGLDFTPNAAAQAIGASTAILFAASVGIAILRYRLYEIDVLINRTFVYGALTAILAGVYTASIALSTRLFSAITGERSDAAVVLATLIVVSLFTPLKSRLQASVDKRLKTAAPEVATLPLAQSDGIEQLRAVHAEWHRAADKGN